MSNNLFILDGQNDNILDHINKKYVTFNEHEQDLPTYKNVFRFTALGDKRYAEHLGKRNKLIVPGEDGELLEFRIFESHKYRDQQGLKVEVWALSTSLDLKTARVIQPHATGSQTAEWHAKQALAGMLFEVGQVAYKGTRSITFDNYTNPYDYLLRIAREFDLELRFYITTNGSKVTGRYVDLVEQVSEWRGRTVEFGRDLQGIRRVEKTDKVVTALLGVGPEREDGTRLEVFVEDREALERWGRNGQHIVEVYEPVSDRLDMTEDELTQYTQTELNKRINAVVSYESDILDLENVPGFDNKKIRFGDTIRIKDLKFNPPLYLEARVHNQKRDVFRRDNKRVVLGDYLEYTEEEVTAIWKQLRQEIQNRVSRHELTQYAEPKKVESDTPPPIAEGENPIWVDTSKELKVAHVAVDGKWEKITPTEADEVNAPSREETIIENENYNGMKWSAEEGFIVERVDGLVRSVLNGTDGIKVQRKENDEWIDVFYVDENGDVMYAGELDGASGRFGKVTVKDGDLILEDSISGQQYSLIPKTNLVRDHSFELCKYIFDTIDFQFGWADFNPAQTYPGGWLNVGNPKITLPGILQLDPNAVIFGGQSAVVNNVNYLNTTISGEPNTQMYASAHFSRHHTLTGGRPKIVIRHLNALGNPIRTIAEQEFSSVPSDSSVVRHSMNFIVPSDFDEQHHQIEVSVRSANQYWVKVDGVQASYGSMPSIYVEDSILFDFLNGGIVAQSLRTEGIESLGNIRVTNGYVYSNIFSHTGQGQHLFFRTNPGYEVRIVDMTGLTSYAPIRADEYLPPNSTRDSKKDIELYDENVLDVIRNANVYTYQYKLDEDNTNRIGIMVDETPRILHGKRGDSIELYALGSFLWKGVQELDEKDQESTEKIATVENQLESLREENQELKRRLEILEQKLEQNAE